MPTDQHSGVYYELHGSGRPLVLAFPLMASQAEIFGSEARAMRDAFVDGLADRFCVLLMDYPGIGRSADIPPEALTAERVCRDFLSVADAAGFDRFTYWGYSWGAAAGLQLAWRTDRLDALVIGGWPPLGGQYSDMLRAALAQADDPPEAVQVVLRSPAQYRQWSTFYGSVQDWPEADAARDIGCPALAYAGADGDVAAGDEWIRNASLLRENRAALEKLGWRVALIEGRSHETCLDPAALLPPVRAFLDEVLPTESHA